MRLARYFIGVSTDKEEENGGGSSRLLQRRGGSGQGITTTRESGISYGAGPPTSTYTQWRGLGDEPKIAGSTGGFIGLISGIAVVVVLSVFAGIWFYNRHRKRLPSRSGSNSKSSSRIRSTAHNRIHNPLPSLSFSRPSTDPYAEAEAELQTGNDFDLDQTPKANRYGFTRPVYTRQKSSDWDLKMDDDEADANGPYELKNDDRFYGYNAKGRKGKDRAWPGAGVRGGGVDVDVEMPSQPDEAAIPLRIKSPRPGLSAIPSTSNNNTNHTKSSSRPRSISSSSLTTTTTTLTSTRESRQNHGRDGTIVNDNDDGNDNSENTGPGVNRAAMSTMNDRNVNINPFENPYDDTHLSPIHSHRSQHPNSTSAMTMKRHGSQSSLSSSSMESDIADEKKGARGSDADPGYGYGHEIEQGGSSGGGSISTNRSRSTSRSASDDGRSVRVSQIRQGSRFVERFESKESLA
ncbi:hypothetical protein IAT40_000515 [Kwoniella sp. CBS 6097]